MTTGITLTDIDRLITSLMFNRVRPTRIEIRSFGDLNFSSTNHGLVSQANTIRGKQLIINPNLLPGTVRVLPEQKFSLCGMFSEWNVFDYGPVPSSVRMNGYLQFVADTTTIQMGFPGEAEVMEEIRQENRESDPVIENGMIRA